MEEKEAYCLGDYVLDVVEGASCLTVVSPFVKCAALEKIVGVLDGECDLEVFTRWHAHEVASGVSDLEILDVVRSFGGEVYLQPHLHAKAVITEDSCLVGSANITLTGLGWTDRPAVELLVETDREEEAVVSMMEVLQQTSNYATFILQEQLRRLADQIEKGKIGDWENDETGEVGGGEHHGRIPRFNVPESVWPAYRGERSEEIARLVRRDLNSLGVPGGIEDKQEFEAVVAAALTQGLTGRLIQECSGVNAVDAADRFREVLESAGVETPVGELGSRYQTFVRWVSHFVSSRTLRATGFSIG